MSLGEENRPNSHPLKGMEADVMSLEQLISLLVLVVMIIELALGKKNS
ncbi:MULTISPECIES: hypothetical protein [Paenibacillus]|nr:MULTISPECIES: hypothetical protein [Paenibacillus]